MDIETQIKIVVCWIGIMVALSIGALSVLALIDDIWKEFRSKRKKRRIEQWDHAD